MGRRKKEPRAVHRETIAAAAERLFLRRGIAAASMDEIAREAGYSKATLYVYFQNKEEIVAVLVLESMKKLRDCLTAALEAHTGAKARYDGICQALLRYQEKFPFYFQAALSEINIEVHRAGALPEERETCQVGEDINRKVMAFLEEGIRAGEIRGDIPLLPTVMAFWGMLAGLIQIAERKEAYFQQALQLSKQAFLEVGFTTLYRGIAAGEGEP